MERRFFLKSLLGLATVAVAGAAASVDANAMPVAQPASAEPQNKPEEAMATAQDLAEVQAEKAQFYYYRRPRYYVRRRYYRPRRRVYFYRPRRRVYFYRRRW